LPGRIRKGPHDGLDGGAANLPRPGGS